MYQVSSLYVAQVLAIICKCLISCQTIKYRYKFKSNHPKKLMLELAPLRCVPSLKSLAQVKLKQKWTQLGSLYCKVYKSLPWLCPVIFVLYLLLTSLTHTQAGPRQAPSLLVRMTDNGSKLSSICTRVREVKVKRHEVTSR